MTNIDYVIYKILCCGVIRPKEKKIKSKEKYASKSREEENIRKDEAAAQPATVIETTTPLLVENKQADPSSGIMESSNSYEIVQNDADKIDFRPISLDLDDMIVGSQMSYHEEIVSENEDEDPDADPKEGFMDLDISSSSSFSDISKGEGDNFGKLEVIGEEDETASTQDHHPELETKSSSQSVNGNK